MNGDTSMVASEMGNFLLLHRKMRYWALYANTPCKVVFLDLLLNASWKACRVHYRGLWIDLLPGDVAVTIKDLASRLSLTEKQVRRSVEMLTKEGAIRATCRAGKCQVISVCKWSTYQVMPDTEGPTKGRAEGELRASYGRAEGKQIEEGKEGEEEKKVKKKNPPNPPKGDLYSEEFEEAWKAYPPTGRSKKRSAFSSWKAALSRGVDGSMIVRRIKEYAASHLATKECGKFVAGMQAWINAEQWNDHPSAWAERQPTLPGINGNGQKRELTWEERHAARKEQYGS